jgi:hypothetical protein
MHDIDSQHLRRTGIMIAWRRLEIEMKIRFQTIRDLFCESALESDRTGIFSNSGSILSSRKELRMAGQSGHNYISIWLDTFEIIGSGDATVR